jgi:hypothetical protein
MTLKEFAEKCGVEVLDNCEKKLWGGKYGWRVKEKEGSSSITVRGYRTELAALKGWAREQLGDKAAKVIMGLLEKQ